MPTDDEAQRELERIRRQTEETERRRRETADLAKKIANEINKK